MDLIPIARRPNIAVLMLTNNAQWGLHPIAMQNGAYACFVKAFTSGEDYNRAIQHAMVYVGRLPKEDLHGPFYSLRVLAADTWATTVRSLHTPVSVCPANDQSEKRKGHWRRSLTKGINRCALRGSLSVPSRELQEPERQNCYFDCEERIAEECL